MFVEHYRRLISKMRMVFIIRKDISQEMDIFYWKEYVSFSHHAVRFRIQSERI